MRPSLLGRFLLQAGYLLGRFLLQAKGYMFYAQHKCEKKNTFSSELALTDKTDKNTHSSFAYLFSVYTHFS
jgi:hypothetical protein